MGQIYKKGLVFLVAVILIPIACSVEKHYHTLSFFFDGVPNPNRDSLSAYPDSAGTFVTDSVSLIAQMVKPEFIVHQPYRERACSMCHKKASMGKLSLSQPELCYTCHINFGELYSNEHGPSVGGYCTECHNPHKSKNEKLLERTGQNLCLDCHGSVRFYESVFHDSASELACDACHNPHGGNEHSLLKKGACYRCHDTFSDQYKVLHGPVSWGQCSQCHIPHRKGTEKLLKNQGRELCFFCHNSKQVLKGDTHLNIEDGECIECHNPHGGEDRYMLN